MPSGWQKIRKQGAARPCVEFSSVVGKLPASSCTWFEIGGCWFQAYASPSPSLSHDDNVIRKHIGGMAPTWRELEAKRTRVVGQPPCSGLRAAKASPRPGGSLGKQCSIWTPSLGNASRKPSRGGVEAETMVGPLTQSLKTLPMMYDPNTHILGSFLFRFVLQVGDAPER